MTQPQQWTGVGRTETGHVRASNQDALALLNDCGVWIVADGMGGHPAGDLAAQTAVAVATQRARERASWLLEHPSAGAEFVADLVTSANWRIHDLMMAQPTLRGMGTTIVALAMTPATPPVAHIAHLGDSRAYLYRAGELKQLTRDHTLVEKFVQRGLIDAAMALTHPERHILTKGLGMGVTMKPELTETPVTPHDLIVLCSDGLTKMLEDAAIASVLSRANGDPYRACHELIEQALSRGGEDNVTVIVVASMAPAIAVA
ncbi:MAG TPA: protein phosphatase 2C domain-containing protein [Nitrospiraceae bacterium]|nr:protein phosphatase 2C domain-containing protein [Nitrospiraceae bacterium]